jgi:hypothetical protein
MLKRVLVEHMKRYGSNTTVISNLKQHQQQMTGCKCTFFRHRNNLGKKQFMIWYNKRKSYVKSFVIPKSNNMTSEWVYKHSFREAYLVNYPYISKLT